jgi:hypothetical protein
MRNCTVVCLPVGFEVTVSEPADLLRGEERVSLPSHGVFRPRRIKHRGNKSGQLASAIAPKRHPARAALAAGLILKDEGTGSQDQTLWRQQ